MATKSRENNTTTYPLNHVKEGEVVKGILKVTNKNGTVSYRARIRMKGYPVVTKTFRTATHAKKWKRETIVQMEKNLYFEMSESIKYTLSDAIKRYCNDELPKRPRNADHVRTHLNWWDKELGHQVMGNIKPSVIAECRDKLLSGTTYRKTKRSPSTVVRYLASLSSLMSVATKEWGWIPENPVKKVTKPQEPKGRTRYLTEEEIRQLLQTCQQSRTKDLYTIVLLALSSGMRRSEVLKLRWRNIDLEKEFILLTETKNDKPRIIPLEGTVWKLLKKKAKHASPDSLLFPSRKDSQMPMDIRSAWEGVLRVAEIRDFRFHDLRHSCASILAMSGHSLLDIARLLGHKSLHSTQRYSHLSHEYTRKMMKNIHKHIFNA